jgi:CIC family chloride channel protein
LIDTYVLVSPWELLIYLLLGLFAGIVGVAFVKTFYSINDLFKKWKRAPYLKPAVGGLCIGIIGLMFPQIFGVGYETVDAVLNDTLGLDGTTLVTLLLALVVVKMIATSLTIGSGGGGGVFSPSLFIGAMLGGAVGTIANIFFPGMIGPAGAYALVGMGALFASVGRATFTSIIIIFEMTLDYHLILPVMFACVVSDAISHILSKETIYTMKLKKKGIRILHDMEVNLLEALTVKKAMVPLKDVVCIPNDISIGEVYSLMMKTEHMGFPMMDGDKCCGIVTFHDIDKAMTNGKIAEPARWFCTRRLIVTYKNESLEKALQKMRRYDISHLPVMSRKDKKVLKGFITKGDILKTYAKKHMKERHKGLFNKKQKAGKG